MDNIPDGRAGEPREASGGYLNIGRALAFRNVPPEWAYVP